MDILTFVNYFNLIKPTYEEIRKSTSFFPAEVFNNEMNGYDLKIISMELFDDSIVDLIENTNIVDLGFSQFHFVNDDSHNSKIGYIEEKGDLFFDVNNKQIEFVDMYKSSGLTHCKINQNVFLICLLKYWELDFNRIYKRENKEINITHDLFVNIEEVNSFYIIKNLLEEIGITVQQFVI